MPTKIKLPAFLEEKLQDSMHEPEVRKALKDFGKWFGDESKQTFFPDYTNHGVQHIEQVLATAANLIPKKARPVFSGADAAALVLAVLLHDSALHLSKAGFWYLIKGAAPHAPVGFFDRDDWGKAWSDFMFLARRWDDTMLLNVFGEEGNTGSPRAQVRDPFDHWSNLTETDGLLIGEFIRKHHPRLAHEMALYGVPGKDGIYLKLADDLPATWRDLAGLLARSHGLPLRTSLDYLRDTPHFGTTGQRSYQNVHAVYLMALLRVADYIQIQGDRTSEKIFTFKDIPSRVSQLEHKAHLSDILISADAEDPESLQIDAHPAEVATFLRLKEWLAGIQQELDNSWAVMGEVYGRYKDLRKLGLTFRRVRSNLDDVAEFAKTVPYVPDRIRFDVARAELLKLLIGPLYGDDPSYGVRELMQNSIDAVREYDQFVLDNPQYKDVPRREQEADVVVELGPFDEEKGYAVMTISDRGIGMTEATIRDYFLRAGASYRRSSEWKSAFESDSTAKVKSKVVRSGRFGVGALAAFLIGDSIIVETRHTTTSEGYSFQTAVDKDIIELKRVNGIKVGTSIKTIVGKRKYEELIKLNDRATRPSFFNWYRFDYPSLFRSVLDSKIYQNNIKGKYELFSSDLKATHWRELIVNDSYHVHWTYNSAPALMCNGFFVSDSEMLKKMSQKIHRNELSRSPIDLPNVLIIDPDGLFPLSLKRDNIRDGRYPFEKELMRDILQELVAWVFFQGPTNLELPIKPTVLLDDSRSAFSDMGIVMKVTEYAIRLAVLLDDHLVNHIIAQPESNLVTKINANDGTLVFVDLFNPKSDNRIAFSIRSKNGKKQKDGPIRQITKNYDEDMDMGGAIAEIGPDGYPSSREIYVTNTNAACLVAATRRCPETKISVLKWPLKGDIGPFVPYFENEDSLYLEERFFPDGCYLKVTSSPWLLDDIWMENFGKEWLPLDIEYRLKKFSKAARFFASKYPQVVPDKIWGILGMIRPHDVTKLTNRGFLLEANVGSNFAPF